MDDRVLITVAEAARRLDTYPNTINRWIDKGELEAFRVEGRGFRFVDADHGRDLRRRRCLQSSNLYLPASKGTRSRAANIAILNTMAQHETTNGARLVRELGDGKLLRKPINELSNMDGAIDSATTANNYVLLYGAFDQFVIADRIGTTVEFIQNLVGANRRPTGQRGVLMWFRTGSDSVNDNAFRLLNVATTA